MAAGKYPSCLLGSRACRTGWLRTVIFLLSVALALNLGLLLDMDRMNEAAAALLEYDDFTSFAKLNSNNKTNICRIMHAAWTADERGVLCFTIRADRFLRNMVRSLVGTLVDVGRGRYTPDGFREIVGSRDLSRSSGGAPAQGLFLSDVVYPPGVFERKMFY